MNEARDIVECPSNDFEPGSPAGQCWGDGHFQCKDCIHYRADFAKNGQDYIDFVHTYQNMFSFSITPLQDEQF